MTGFETFTRRLIPMAKEPRITIQKRGAISLNISAYAALGSPGAVELLFDREKRIVGLRAVAPTCPHAYPVRSASGNGSGPFVVSALAFIRYFGLVSDTSLRWDAYLDSDVLCADLGTPGVTVTSNRARPGTGRRR